MRPSTASMSSRSSTIDLPKGKKALIAELLAMAKQKGIRYDKVRSILQQIRGLSSQEKGGVEGALQRMGFLDKARRQGLI